LRSGYYYYKFKAMKKNLLICLFLVLSTSLFAQSWCWGREGVGTIKANDYNSAVATDRYGNAYFTGTYEYIMHMDTAIIKDSAEGMFLLKLNPAGHAMWLTQPQSALSADSLHFSKSSYGLAVATDNSNNIFVGGYGGGIGYPISFGTYQVYGGYVVKYNPAGTVLWATSLPGDVFNVATDNTGNVYAPLKFNDRLFKYSSGGAPLWNILIDSNYNSQPNCVVSDNNKNVYVAGGFISNMLAAHDTLKANGGREDVFLIKYDSLGNLLWAKQSQVPSSYSLAIGEWIVTDKADNVYVTGYFSDTVSFGPYKLIAKKDSAIFLVKYSPLGKVIWAKQSSNHRNWRGYSLSSDDHNHIYLGGSGYGDTVQFGSAMLTKSDTNLSSFILQFDTSGIMLAGSILDNGVTFYNNEFQIAISSDTSGNYIYMGGTFHNDTVIYGPDILKDSNGGVIPYFARWSFNGECLSQVINTTDEITKTNTITSLYPNPNNGKFTIQLSEATAIAAGKSLTAEIYNMLGQKAYASAVRPGDQIDLSNQASGLYLYRVITENGQLMGEGKVIIQK
jgi:hypothetical protein